MQGAQGRTSRAVCDECLVVMERNRVTLRGVVSEPLTSGGTANIEGARVAILDGLDAGKADTSGRFGRGYKIFRCRGLVS